MGRFIIAMIGLAIMLVALFVIWRIAGPDAARETAMRGVLVFGYILATAVGSGAVVLTQFAEKHGSSKIERERWLHYMLMLHGEIDRTSLHAAYAEQVGGSSVALAITLERLVKKGEVLRVQVTPELVVDRIDFRGRRSSMDEVNRLTELMERDEVLYTLSRPELFGSPKIDYQPPKITPPKRDLKYKPPQVTPGPIFGDRGDPEAFGPVHET